MNEDDDDKFLQRLQERHEQELAMDMECAKQPKFKFDAEGRIVGGTNPLKQDD